MKPIAKKLSRPGAAVVLALLLLLPAALTACAQPMSAPTQPAPEPTSAPTPRPVDPAAIAARYPRVDGSTSAHPLQIMAGCRILGVQCEWKSPFPPSIERRIVADRSVVGPIGDLKRPLPESHSGTHESYVNLIEGKVDFILVAREPSAEELEAAKRAGVGLEAVPVALDAFVFLLNVANPLPGLTLDQARGIYTGKLSSWEQLGANLGPIKAYQRDKNSGSQELMEALVLKGERPIEAPDMLLFGMAGPINAVGTQVPAIGYSVYYYAAFMLPDPQVKLAAIDGVAPTSETIKQRAYPLIAEVYAVVRAGMPPDSPAILLRDWLLTPDGQKAVAESGYVTLR